MPIAVGNPAPWRPAPTADMDTLVALGREEAPPEPSPDPPPPLAEDPAPLTTS